MSSQGLFVDGPPGEFRRTRPHRPLRLLSQSPKSRLKYQGKRSETQLVKIVWFRYKGIGSVGIRIKTILGAGQRAQQDDRRLRMMLDFANPRREFETIHSGHVHIEDDQFA